MIRTPSFLAACALVLGLVSCRTPSPDEATPQPAEPQQQTERLVAVATLMSHPALDQLIAEMKSQVTETSSPRQERVTFEDRNASGQMTMVSTIAQEVCTKDFDVVVAVTTPMAQAVAKQCSTTPVVFAAVTDPVGAGLVNSLDEPKPGITGTSDAWPYREQLELIRELMPKATRLGVLYNPGEAASQYGIKKIREAAPEFGFEIIEGAAGSTPEVRAVAAGLAPRVDALFLSSDNTVIAAAPAVVKVAIDSKKPLFVGDSGTVEKGGLAAVSVGYAELGLETGKLVSGMLEGNTSQVVVVGRGTDLHINTKAAELMGLEVPAEFIEKAAQVYQEISE